jgi:hypothetical protein
MLLALAGCGSSSSSSSASSSGSGGSASTGASSQPSSAPTGLAAPGTTLPAGRTALVRMDTVEANGSNGPSYKLKVTVASIQQGTLADFKGVQLDASQKASQPTYVQVQITNLGPRPITGDGNDPSAQVQGVDSTGSTQESITFLGDFPRCDEKLMPKPFATGKSFSTCLTFMVPGGIKKVAYTGTEAYNEKPVIWTSP